MKSLIKAVALAVILAAPVVSFAQSNQPVTRAQVRAELVQLEKAGYHPEANDLHYPADLQAAEARVAAQNGVVETSVGASTAGSSQSGRPAVAANNINSVYFGH